MNTYRLIKRAELLTTDFFQFERNDKNDSERDRCISRSTIIISTT